MKRSLGLLSISVSETRYFRTNKCWFYGPAVEFIDGARQWRTYYGVSYNYYPIEFPKCGLFGWSGLRSYISSQDRDISKQLFLEVGR